MSSEKARERKTVGIPADPAGSFSLNLGVFAAIFSGFACVFILLCPLLPLADDFFWCTFKNARVCGGVCVLSVAWVGFWTNLKRIAEDVYVARQILENRESGGSGDERGERQGVCSK